MVECHFWVINSPIETGSSASSCLRIKGQLCAINGRAACPDFWKGRDEKVGF
jgi:hypothetical protein